jgi:hypothetical protein
MAVPCMNETILLIMICLDNLAKFYCIWHASFSQILKVMPCATQNLNPVPVELCALVRKAMRLELFPHYRCRRLTGNNMVCNCPALISFCLCCSSSSLPCLCFVMLFKVQVNKNKIVNIIYI